jgi:hypothetical protein
MSLLSDIFYAILFAGLPLMALTFAVIWWALHRGRLRGESVGELQKSIQALAARQKSDKKKAKQKNKGNTGRKRTAKHGADFNAMISGTEPLDSGGDPDRPRKSAEKLDPVLEKWFSFGGGFYGLVALYTWLVIEWNEVWGFLSDLPGIVFSVDLGALIGLVVGFFIESLMNFITAIAWPIYWLDVAGNPWVWIAVAYGGYWLGIKAAQQAMGKRWLGETPDLAGAVTRSDDDDESGRA